MKQKRLIMLCAIVLLMLLIPQLAMNAEATSTSASGYCGEELKWSFSGTSLTITGKGKMYDYYSYSSTPWSSYRARIEKITIGDQVESIGNNAFAYFSNLKTVTVNNPIQAKIISIGSKAFYSCGNLTTVTGLPSSLRNVYTSAFEGCSSLTSASFYATSAVWKQVVSVSSYNTALTNKLTYGTQTHPNHPICGLTCKCTDTHHVAYYWNEWDGKSGTSNYYKYYLKSDMYRNTGYTFSGGGTGHICLNGHSLYTEGNAEGLEISSGTALVLTDCGTTGELSSRDSDDGSYSSNEYAIFNNGTFTLYNGTLNAGGYAVFNEEGATLNVYGGTVDGVEGGIWNYGNANLYGGKIKGEMGDSIWNSGGKMIIDGAEFNGSVSNNGTAEIYSALVNIESSYDGIDNAGTMTIYDVDFNIPAGKYGNAVEVNSGTLHIRGGSFPASQSTYGSQYYGLAVYYSNAKVYVSGTPNLEAVYVRYPNTLYLRSSDGSSSFLTDNELKFRVDSYNFGSTGIAAANVSSSVWDKTVQINSYGEPSTQDGELTFNGTNILFAKVLYSGKCGDNLYWKLDGNGKLTIYGTGAMYDYTSSSTPWYSYRSQIKKVAFEEGCTYIGNNAFMYCNKMQSIDFGNNTMTMGDYCFGYCDALTTVDVPAGVQLGYCAFHYCIGLKSATVACPEIPKFAFELCTNLTSLTLKEGVTTVVEGALRRTDSLKSVTFPASVERVEWSIFANNSNGNPVLTDITFLSNETEIHAGMLNYMTPGNITIHGDECSTAAAFAKKANCKFEAFPNGISHKPMDVGAVEADCTNKGREAGTVCSVCDAVISGCAEIPALKHSFTEYTDDGEHICNEMGTQSAKCDRCEATDTISITFGHHFAEYIYNNDATCTADGTRTAKCVYCDETHTIDAPDTKTDHSWSGWKEIQAPGCKSEGQERRDCDNCDAYTLKAIPALDHDWQQWQTVTEATCIADGLRRRDCSRCTSYEQETLTNGGHNWGQWETVEEAGCTTDGYEQRNCTLCSAPEYNTLAALNHSYEAEIFEPTCTEGGYTLHTCQRCSDSYVNGENDPLGHDPDENGICSRCAEVGGRCGESAFWKYDRNGTLTIYGSGATENYVYTGFATPVGPWASYQDEITRVIVEDGITSIGENAFRNMDQIQQVDLPESLSKIGANAFSSCKALEEVELPDSLEVLGLGAFGYSGIETLHLGPNVELYRGGMALNAMQSLTTLTVDGNNPYYTAVDGVLYSKDLTTLVYYPGGLKAGEYTVLPDTTTIGLYAFAQNSHIQKINLPEGLQEIGMYAFYDCRKLAQIELPDSITILGEHAFYSCYDLKNLRIPSGVTKLESSILSLIEMEELSVSASVSVLKNLSLGWLTVQRLVFEGDCPEIGDKAFSNSKATVYYPLNANGWTEDTLKNYGGNLTWIAYCPDHSFEIDYTWTEDYSSCTALRRCTTAGCQISATETVKSVVSVTPSTCAVPGSTSYSAAFVGEYFETQVIDIPIETLDHSWGSWEVVTEATCTDQGQERRDCMECDACETNPIPALNHSYEAEVFEPTCTEGGYTLYTCGRCSDSYRANEVAPMDHAYLAEETLADCENGGYMTNTCIRCGDSYISHETASLGHSWGDGAVIKPATETEPGIRRFTCGRCGDFRDETISALTHTHKYTSEYRAPTCTEDGATVYTCEGCGESYQEVIHSGGHKFGKWYVYLKPTCSKPGEKRSDCANCDSYQFETLSMTSHVWGAWELTKVPTAASKGEEVRKCTGCEKTERRDVAKLSHPFVDVEPGRFYEAPVVWAVANGITNGVDPTHFAPDKICSRAEVVTFLWRASGKPEPVSGVNPFVDVKEGTFYYTAVLWAVEEGITKGTSATEFSPSAECTRGQVATFLWRALEEPEVRNPENPFVDAFEGRYYYTAVLWAAESGVTKGMDDTHFAPDALCNRGQIVTFLHRALNLK